jgi:hypothetical protein
MARTGRPGLSQQQKDELWQRWKDAAALYSRGGLHSGRSYLPSRAGSILHAETGSSFNAH